MPSLEWEGCEAFFSKNWPNLLDLGDFFAIY